MPDVNNVHLVDEMLPLGKLIVLGLQRVLVMYAGAVGVTGIRSRWGYAAGGVILLLFGLFPKMAHVVASVPPFVLGGGGIVIFGMVAATGIWILAGVDFVKQHSNPYVIAISIGIGIGMTPLVADKFFQFMPKSLSPLMHTGVLLVSISAVALNLYFNGTKSPEEAAVDAATNAAHVDVG